MVVTFEICRTVVSWWWLPPSQQGYLAFFPLLTWMTWSVNSAKNESWNNSERWVARSDSIILEREDLEARVTQSLKTLSTHRSRAIERGKTRKNEAHATGWTSEVGAFLHPTSKRSQDDFRHLRRWHSVSELIVQCAEFPKLGMANCVDIVHTNTVHSTDRNFPYSVQCVFVTSFTLVSSVPTTL